MPCLLDCTAAASFTAAGAGLPTERLVLLDRSGEDRRACVECRDLTGHGLTGCWYRADPPAEAHFQHSTNTVKPLAFSAIAVGASGLSELALA